MTPGQMMQHRDEIFEKLHDSFGDIDTAKLPGIQVLMLNRWLGEIAIQLASLNAKFSELLSEPIAVVQLDQ